MPMSDWLRAEPIEHVPADGEHVAERGTRAAGTAPLRSVCKPSTKGVKDGLRAARARPRSSLFNRPRGTEQEARAALTGPYAFWQVRERICGGARCPRWQPATLAR
jgi:hypothetical protein